MTLEVHEEAAVVSPGLVTDLTYERPYIRVGGGLGFTFNLDTL